jgi:hypothetical protein
VATVADRFRYLSTEIEEIGWTLLEGVVQSNLELNSSAFLFSADEKLKLKAALLIPLLFDWNAILARADGKSFVSIDHDSQITITITDQRLASEIKMPQLLPWIKNTP